MPSENRLILFISMFISALLLGLSLVPSKPFSGSLAGHLIGISGTVLMALTLIYPFRKRLQGKKGKRNPIASHIYFGLSGPTLVAVHAGNGLASPIGTLTFLLMVLVVLSGISGAFLFRRVNRSLKEQRADLENLERLFLRHREEIGTEECAAYLQAGELSFGEDLGSVDISVKIPV